MVSIGRSRVWVLIQVLSRGILSGRSARAATHWDGAGLVGGCDVSIVMLPAWQGSSTSSWTKDVSGVERSGRLVPANLVLPRDQRYPVR